MGGAEILGIQLMENFDAPYLSLSISEFWRCWHISLTSWFKDYLYIPLGGSHKGKIRKYMNKMIVFLLSGLWHGAQFSYVAWGGLNGLYQIAGEILQPIRDKMVSVLQLNRKSFGHKLLPSGAKKVTDYLGKYIVENYNVFDQSENETYSSWHNDYESYKNYKIAKLKEQTSLDTYLMLLADKNYTLLFEINAAEIWENDYYVKLLENVGIDSSKITKNTDFFIIQDQGKHAEYFEDFYQKEGLIITTLGEMYLSSEGRAGYKVYLNNKELYTVTQNEENDLRIVVIDKETAEVLDYVSFSVQTKSDIQDGQIIATKIYRSTHR